MPDTAYIHGTAPAEQERLARLNAMTNGAFVAFLNPRPTDVVLEIGSGLGLLAREVAARVPGGRVIGLEFSEDQLRVARGRAVAPNLEFVAGDAHAPPFADGTFDLVYGRYILEHLRDPLRAVQEARRVLKPGGRLAVQENNIEINRFDPPCPRFELLWAKFGKLQARLGGDAYIGRRLFRLLRQAGFERVELSVAPEVHWSGSPGFEPWVTNLIGNIRSGEKALTDQGLASAAEIGGAIRELQELMRRPDGSAIFYWNRAAAVR